MHTCALLANGDMYCWGEGEQGQIGYGNSTTTYSPQLVLLPRSAIAIGAGDSHTCAILDNNSMMCWGSNDFGQVGDGTENQRDVPVYVENFIGANVYPIAVSGEHGTLVLCLMMVVSIAGEEIIMVNWGLTQEIVQALSLFHLVATFQQCKLPQIWNHNCVLLTNKTLNCWGQNNWGQVGDGTTTNKFVPTYVEMENQESVEYVSASKNGVCVVLENLKLSCWGANYDGQVGDGTTITKLKPTSIGTMGFKRNGLMSEFSNSLSSKFYGDTIHVTYQNTSDHVESMWYSSANSAGGNPSGSIQHSASTNMNSLALGPNGEMYVSLTFENNIFLMGSDNYGGNWYFVESDYHLLGVYSDLDMDDFGNLHMVYRDAFEDELRYSISNETDISFEVIDSSTESGLFNNIEVDIYGNVHIAYKADDKLKYAKKLSTSNNWIVSTIDSVQGSGLFASMTLDQWQNPHISYGTGGQGLRYAAFNGTGWNIETVDSNQAGVYFTSIAIDGMQNVHIAASEFVSNYTEFNLNHAKKNMNSTGGWSISDVDNNGNVGLSANIVIDSFDNVHIGYIDFGAASIKLATQMAGTTNYNISSIYSGTELQRIGMDLDSNDDFHFSIIDTGTNKIWYMNNIGGSWSDSYIGPIIMLAETELMIDGNDDVHISYLTDLLEAGYVTISGLGDYLGASLVSEDAFEPYGMIEFDNHTYFVATDSQGGVILNYGVQMGLCRDY